MPLHEELELRYGPAFAQGVMDRLAQIEEKEQLFRQSERKAA